MLAKIPGSGWCCLKKNQKFQDHVEFLKNEVLFIDKTLSYGNTVEMYTDIGEIKDEIDHLTKKLIALQINDEHQDLYGGLRAFNFEEI